jgi:hypothetical protein
MHTVQAVIAVCVLLHACRPVPQFTAATAFEYIAARESFSVVISPLEYNEGIGMYVKQGRCTEDGTVDRYGRVTRSPYDVHFNSNDAADA